uniref:Olfactory receptor n=1 Tax=Erpetoichthys calabaricus TaxID=27687 RepID=A0A8C4XG53_ERPCA
MMFFFFLHIRKCINSVTSVVHLILTGFLGFRSEESRRGLFGVLLTTYLLILLGNFILILIFACDRLLHTPMYVLICGLAVLDIGITTTIMPTMLISVPFVPCFMQMIFHMGLFTTECFHLALMAYDRYLAICKPLYYPNLMYNTHALKLMACCWMAGFFFATSCVTLVLRFPFCRPITINNCFCDIVSLLFLACGDIFITGYILLLVGLSVTFIPLLYILFSYVRITSSVLRIPSSKGRMKAFYTCGTHMLVISVLFVIAIGVFISDKIPGASMDIRIVGLIMQNVFPPLMNPVIYCLRTKEIQNSFVKMLKKFRILPFSVQEY